MNRAIEEFIARKRIAIVGVSRSGKKFGNYALTQLASRGYQVFPVHPSAEAVGGIPCSPNLLALKGTVDAVLVILPPTQVLGVLRDAATIGVRSVWLQQGAESSDALALAQELGLSLVAKKCVLMYAPPVGGFHVWHRAVMRLFGKL